MVSHTGMKGNAPRGEDNKISEGYGFIRLERRDLVFQLVRLAPLMRDRFILYGQTCFERNLWQSNYSENGVTG